MPTTPENFWQRVKRGRGCWRWCGYHQPDGYGKVHWRGRRRPVHRVAWEFKYGAPPDDIDVLHRCDVRDCCKPSHLFLGTQADNMADKTRKGRQYRPQGERHPQAKLSNRAVQFIRASSWPQPSLARRFGVDQSAISRVRTGKRWAHVGKDG